MSSNNLPQVQKLIFYIPNDFYYVRLLYLLDKMNYKNYHIVVDINEIKNDQPYIVPFTPHIPHFENANLVFNDTIFELMKDHRCFILYDTSTESINYSGYTQKKLIEFHQLLQKHKAPLDRIFLISANQHINEGYNDWCKNKDIKPINIIGYNFYMFEFYWRICSDKWFKKNYNNIPRVIDNKRDKLYMCLNLKPRSHRVAIMLNLIAQNALENGAVSYFGEEFGSGHAETVEGQQETIKFISELEKSKLLKENIDILNSISPINLDLNSKDIHKKALTYIPDEVDFLIPEAQNQPDIINLYSYFEIANETWFTDQTTLYITEKTMRPILRMQFFILVGCPFTLQKLQSMGFRTFNSVIDESYDSVSDPVKRMDAIIKEIDKLTSLPQSQIIEIYNYLKPNIEHNYKHFFNATSTNFVDETNLLFSRIESVVNDKFKQPKPFLGIFKRKPYTASLNEDIKNGYAATPVELLSELSAI